MFLQIDDPKQWTPQQFARLIASKDDAQHRQLRVSEKGQVYLSDTVGAENLNGVRLQYHTFCAGHGECGRIAATDRMHVTAIFDKVTKAWAEGYRGHLEFFGDTEE